MSQIGTQVLTSETPPATSNPNSTAAAFFVGIADWGNSGPTGVNVAVNSMTQAAAIIGGPTGSGVQAARSSTNATLYDSLDAFFHEGGSTAYISRVLGASGNASATIALAPTAAVTLTAQYPGFGGNGIFVTVVNNTTNAVITLTDSNGNVLATSPQCTTLAAIVTWAATTGIVTATTSGSSLPQSASSTQMSGGSNGTTPTLTQWSTAINSFGSGLGPGQVLAPGQTNTVLSGIWSTLATHATNNNRIALCDETDGVSVATVATDIATAALPTALQSYTGIWAGNLLIPGLSAVSPSTARNIPPSPVIAALCARVDATGNPNLAAAGVNFSLQYATQSATVVSGAGGSTYSLSDLNTLNNSGVNSFQSRFGVFENYGFVSAELQTNDAIYWQLNHGRLRMALVQSAYVVAEPFVFSQIDGSGTDISQFNTAIQSMLQGYFQSGALYGVNATDAFSVNTGPTVNTPTLLAAGQLTALVAVRMSPFAEFVQITLNAVPITQTVPQTASPAQNQ